MISCRSVDDINKRAVTKLDFEKFKMRQLSEEESKELYLQAFRDREQKAADVKARGETANKWRSKKKFYGRRSKPG